MPATPDNLAEMIEDALARRQELGRRGRAYVERWHGPIAIARRLKADYEPALGR